jgi:nitrite reductase (NADH) small subunit
MPDFLTVAKVGDIPEGEGRSYPVNGKMIALFNLGGEYSAINDTCPHMGASLATGYIEDNGVVCPWHAWRFCIKNGTWLDSPNSKLNLDCYEVRIEGDEIRVEVPVPPETKADSLS